ncbi:hypothetical protein AB4560_21330 [Vibrio sp. 10N.222.51.C12]|uniref:hypothetical protein n=1 Tax=Vibrio sp. 10N.222.51.C12 TaxID=3229622 RepID=UPI00354E53F9
MSKVQCTFRLPVEVVELIDEQDGDTRTDKLLSLLGFSSGIVSYGVRQIVVDNRVEERLLELEKRVTYLESDAEPRVQKISRPANSSYEERTNNVIDKCRAAWLELEPEQRQTITKKGFSEISGVARGTVTKYWTRFTSDCDES